MCCMRASFCIIEQVGVVVIGENVARLMQLDRRMRNTNRVGTVQ
jgi:hypothetical protein